jgi:hypothetical protein
MTHFAAKPETPFDGGRNLSAEDWAVWQNANQQRLSAELERVGAQLESHCRQNNAEPPLFRTSEPPPDEVETALERIVSAYKLSDFERDLLLLCAGIELDGRFASLCATLNRNVGHNLPTFSLALAFLTGGYWSAIAPTAPLRRARLLSPLPDGGATPITLCPLRIDEWVLHYLTGVIYPDSRLPGILIPLADTDPLIAGNVPEWRIADLRASMHMMAASHRALAKQLADHWQGIVCEPNALPLLMLCGDAEDDKLAVAWTATRRSGLRLRSLNVSDLPLQRAEQEALLALWEREARLMPVAMFIDAGGVRTVAAESGEVTETLLHGPDGSQRLALLERMPGPLVLAAEARVPFRRTALCVDVDYPSPREQVQLWLDASAVSGLSQDVCHALQAHGGLGQIVTQFHLSAAQISAAVAEGTANLTGDNAEAIQKRYWSICRKRARVELDAFAQRIEVRAGWNDLILPPPQLHMLKDLITQMRHRAVVQLEWEFAGRGAGITALFAGGSGAGKTLAAEVIAHELDIDLYRIDLASIVSKYIGETEKNLRHLFAGAERSGVALLFDEADALFGKRSEVRDSHDRYANIEVSYLLQRMESYRGLAILTTNIKNAVDTAFYRRFRVIIEFPPPDAERRAAIWRHIFPPTVPLDANLDYMRLAQLNFSGGNIYNCALNAAFLAARDARPVNMTHIERAARAECAKVNRRLTEVELEGWETDATLVE